MRRLFLIPCLLTSFSVCCQNIGIGTSTPTKGKLEVVGVAGAGNTTAIFGSNANGISLQQNWPTIGFNQYRDNTVGNGRFMSDGYAALQYMDPNGGGMYIDMLGAGLANTLTSSGIRAVSILNNGCVGILSNGSTASLTVGRGTGAEGTAMFRGTNNHSYINYSATENTYLRAGKDGATVYINDINNGLINLGGTTGKVGINLAVPAYALHIKESPDGFGSSSGIGIQSQYGDEWELRNVTTFYFLLNGILKSSINPASGGWNALSDKRLKKNFRDIGPVLDKVMRLQALQYDMINAQPGAAPSNGFIAQDVKKLFPELVTVIDDPNHRMGYKDISDPHLMDYSGFGVIAIKAIQEQEQQMKEMEKRITLLEEQNKLLLQLLNKK